MIDKIKVFEKELRYIQDNDIREFTEKAINILPDYFFEIPASSTGKYHPTYALGNGGLVRHVRAAVNIAYCMFNNVTITSNFTQRHKDIIISALLLHDGLKKGFPEQEYVIDNHAVQVCNYLEMQFKSAVVDSIYNIIMNDVFPLIQSHMGQWNTSKNGVIHSPLPNSGPARYVHMCDYLASRKLIDINFDAI